MSSVGGRRPPLLATRRVDPHRGRLGTALATAITSSRMAAPAGVSGSAAETPSSSDFSIGDREACAYLTLPRQAA